MSSFLSNVQLCSCSFTTGSVSELVRGSILMSRQAADGVKLGMYTAPKMEALLILNAMKVAEFLK